MTLFELSAAWDGIREIEYRRNLLPARVVNTLLNHWRPRDSAPRALRDDVPEFATPEETIKRFDPDAATLAVAAFLDGRMPEWAFNLLDQGAVARSARNAKEIA